MFRLNTLKYPDPQGYYVVSSNGQLNWVSVPFCVSCIEAVGTLKERDLFLVDQVGTTISNEVVFIIGNSGYSHHYFTVVMPDMGM